MYRSVYFHKTTRAAEVMLRLTFKRFKQLLEREGSDPDAQTILPGAPSSAVAAFAGRLTLHQYLALDDHAMTEFFKVCATAEDELLRDLGSGLLNRKLYKAIDVTDISSQSCRGQPFGHAVQAVRSRCREAGHPDLHRDAGGRPPADRPCLRKRGCIEEEVQLIAILFP
jgi:HD superfamily phosphohydrolase